MLSSMEVNLLILFFFPSVLGYVPYNEGEKISLGVVLEGFMHYNLLLYLWFRYRFLIVYYLG
jgi:hypothetical protein